MRDEAIPTSPSEKLLLRINLDRRINFAIQQNDVPVVKSLHVENHSDMPLSDIRVRITAVPEFALPWEARIQSVPISSTYNVEKVNLVLSPQYLFELTEKIRGQLRFELLQGEKPLFECMESVDLLCRDEWSGISSLPEILAAFVMPNHPAIERILKDTAGILDAWTSNSSLSGYQTRDPKRVYTMAGAIYAAIQHLDLSYINPPASFEDEGQRIRLPDRIIESRMGTCLDLAVLTAACIEQAGLNPLIVLVKSHAIVGVWLHDQCFPEPAIDQPLRLSKRVDLDEIAVFDSTCVTNHPLLSFDAAAREAKRRLERPEEFVCVIDVARARKGQIRPLPERVNRQIPDEAAHAETPKEAACVPDVSRLHTATPGTSSLNTGVQEAGAIRLDRWRRRLLDLSLRNRLLNFRETKKTIPLLCPDLSALDDDLAEGATFHILPRPHDLDENSPRNQEAYRYRTGDDAIEKLLREEFKAKRLRADLTQAHLDTRLLEVYRTARLQLEEGGASALYLAIGFLAWHETPESTERRLAPIILLPLDLHRKSVREGFTLRLGNDEPRLNMTLLELLRQDYDVVIHGLDPLPEDESGLDVRLILHTIREAIRDIDNWDVIETAEIGIFSFAKFLMWRDLAERASDLMKNLVVDHLVNHPNEEFQPGATFPDPDRLDEDRPPLKTFCPLPTDSSQLAAVFAAADGRSFVLEGPPGTGKSQTITNLIAHCLAEDKRVLFVSEKMAALNVVHERLQKVGLGRYCLELHSNKADKRGMLTQLNDALHQYQNQSSEEWEREARRLEALRNELNAYVQALHKRRSTGETIFHATSHLIGLRNIPLVDLHWSSPDAIGANELALLRDLVDRLAITAAAVGEVPGHSWSTVHRPEWSPAWQQQVLRAIEHLMNALDAIEPRAVQASSRFSLGEGGWSFNELALMDELAGVLLDSPAPPVAMLIRPDWEEIQDLICKWIEHGHQRDLLRAKVFECFDEKVLSLDVGMLEQRLQIACQRSWPMSWWQYRRVHTALKNFAKDGKAPVKGELASILRNVSALCDQEKSLAAAGEQARVLLGRFWKDGEADWKAVEGVRNWTRSFRSLSVRVAGDDFDRAAKLREHWSRIVTEGQDLLRKDAVIGRELLAYRSAYNAFRETKEIVDALLDVEVDSAWGGFESPDLIGVMRRRLRSWSERMPELNSWCAWRRVRAEAMRANLAPLVEAYERGEFSSHDLTKVFKRAYYEWWYTAIVSNEPVLAQFFSPNHERTIEHFREVDERHMRLTRDLIAARLAKKVPSTSTVEMPNSEVGILKREIGKKRRNMSVRQLFQTIPRLLTYLKPCLLMSPMSVAQFLDSSYPPFDIVVFDEASQIPVWDAVGAIARGTQAIIVGDPKQLPPTSFFQRVDEADEEEPIETESIEDLESILDDCISARLPWLPLNWHYRSRDETLIAFSNYHYYDNRLLTFPSAYREGLGVKWCHVPSGVYDRGKSATNHAEAEAIVKDILRRLKDKALSQWSIGVVTFSQAQQVLIENLLENVRHNDPEVDQFFSEEAQDRVFVKNLENVQGDERDVILFSICYGPDSLGRVSMNFGPMNREGGERRLNVAITRARREVIIYSSLRADQIDLSRCRARGVRDLKNFLEYAERGPSAIAEATRFDAEADFDSPFEKEIYDILVGKGWEIHKQVGCARYRIDLAVVDLEVPGRYLLGIECDGANYHRAKTARDRDKLRQAILQDLGWKLHRIWSTDWWTNPAQEIRKLEAAIDKAKHSWRQVRLTSDALETLPNSHSQIALVPMPVVQSKHQDATSQISSEATAPVYRPYAQKRRLAAVKISTHPFPGALSSS